MQSLTKLVLASSCPRLLEREAQMRRLEEVLYAVQQVGNDILRRLEELYAGVQQVDPNNGPGNPDTGSQANVFDLSQKAEAVGHKGVVGNRSPEYIALSRASAGERGTVDSL